MPIDDEDRSNPNISHPWGPLCHSPQYPVFNTRGLLSLSLQRFPVSISRHCFKFLKLHGYQGTCHSPAGTIVSGFSPASAEALSSRPARLESTYNYSWILSIRNLAAGDLEGAVESKYFTSLMDCTLAYGMACSGEILVDSVIDIV